MSPIRFAAVVATAATALLAASCDKVPLLAPSASTITLVVSSTVVPVNGTTTVAANVIEPAGTPVQNGTVVTFVASFGRLDPAEARTENGKATVQFIAGPQSGTARITAFSGGVSASTTADNDIKIGGAAAAKLFLRAEPPSVSINGGTSTIVASVVDAVGNPLAGVPVTFIPDSGTVSPATSVTDAAGEARTTLTVSRTTIVTASAGGQTATVTVNAQSPTIGITPPANIEAGVPAIFTLTPPAASATTNPIRSVAINWGDGTPIENLGAITAATPVTHTYQNPGSYRITATVTDTQGITGDTFLSIIVNERAPVPVTVSASTPNPSSFAVTQGLVTFTCTAPPPAGAGTVTFFDWSLGDGGSTFTTANTYPYRYQGPGTYVVRCRVRTTTGAEGSGEMTYRLNP